MISEQVTGRNFFSFLGGISEYTMARDGGLRSIGAFSHPILAGTFGAILLPHTMAYWHLKKNKIITLLGIISSIIITLTSSSSGPIFSLAAGIGGLLMLRLWKHTRIIFWTSIFLLICITNIRYKSR